MTEEVMMEICKAYNYGYPMEKIVEIEEVTMEEVKEAIDWGYDNNYFAELKGRGE
jgi:hypothetical protein